jgi:hypothetical protein
MQRQRHWGRGSGLPRAIKLENILDFKPNIRSGERELPASARHAKFSLPLRTPFKPDDLVFHPRFGPGRIIEEWGSWLDVDPDGEQTRSCGGTGVFEVEFETSGRRSVNSSRLTPIEFAGYEIQANS